jgi:hypothetical protein
LEEIQSTEAYIPGVCNIGPGEVNKRLRIGYIGLALMIIFIISAGFFDFPPVWKLALFAPTVYAISGFLQARQKFCFMYGFFGLFGFAGKRSRVKDDAQAQLDKSKALKLIGQIFFISTAITLLYYFFT